MMDGVMGCPGSMALFGWLLGLAALALIVLAIAWLARELLAPRRDSQHHGEHAALRELDARYASGEIDRDTYSTIRSDLLHAEVHTIP